MNTNGNGFDHSARRLRRRDAALLIGAGLVVGVGVVAPLGMQMARVYGQRHVWVLTSSGEAVACRAAELTGCGLTLTGCGVTEAAIECLHTAQYDGPEVRHGP